jgi:hypothetical protein
MMVVVVEWRHRHRHRHRHIQIVIVIGDGFTRRISSRQIDESIISIADFFPPN